MGGEVSNWSNMINNHTRNEQVTFYLERIYACPMAHCWKLGVLYEHCYAQVLSNLGHAPSRAHSDIHNYRVSALVLMCSYMGV